MIVETAGTTDLGRSAAPLPAPPLGVAVLH